MQYNIMYAHEHHVSGFHMVQNELRKYNSEYKILYNDEEILYNETEILRYNGAKACIEFNCIEDLVEFKLRWS